MLLATVSVRSLERISPSFLRVEFGGPELAEFGIDGPGYDQRLKLVFPGPDGLPELDPQTWWQDYCALPEGERGHVRTYTLREVRGSGSDTRVVVDFVLHADAHGPGSGWAEQASIGDELLLVGPRRGSVGGGIEWTPGEADRLLLVGDETAVPAACAILEALPADARGTAFLEVPVAADVQPVAAPEGVTVTWLPRDGAALGSLAAAAVGRHLGLEARAAVDGEVDPDLWETPAYSSSGEAIAETSPGDGRYAWIAGESGMVTTLRRHLVNELGMPRRQVAFMGYWRVGVAMKA